jgi:hypothetical protein
LSKRDDINKLYVPSQKLGEFCKIVFWLNCALAIANLFLSGLLLEILTAFQITLSMAFVAASLIDDGLYWYSAESERRKNNFQTAFGIRFSELETEGYYNNNLSPSVLKYAVNTFESNYFSKFIASKILFKSAIKSLVAVIVLISAGWLIADKSILLVISQAIFSAYIVEDTVLLAIYTNRLNKLYDSIYSMLVTSGIHKSQQIPILLLYCVEYESVKAHYKVRLDSKVFSKYNHELSDKWERIVSEINISIPEEDTKYC